MPARERRVASMIDHTLLRADATRGDIEVLCREAREERFAAVCVNPVWVSRCADLVRGSAVTVASVVGFPLGGTMTDAKQYETRRALCDGAGEIDMVMNIGALKSGDLRLVERDLTAVIEACGAVGGLSKVIIETALLTEAEKVVAARLVMAAGADFVKTSTGFGPGGATVADVTLLRHVVGETIGVKASGGIRDLRSLEALVAAGATRIGTSAGVGIMQEARRDSSRPHGDEAIR